MVETSGKLASLDSAILAADLSKFLLAHPLVNLCEEENAIVGLTADISITWCELDLVLAIAANVIGHSDLGHGSTLVHSEGGERRLLVLEVHVRHAVDGKQ